MKIPENTIAVPPLCDWHQHDLVAHRLQIPEEGPWRVAIFTANLLCFTWLTTNPRFNARIQPARDENGVSQDVPRDMSLVLAEVGCPACFDPEGLDRAAILLRRDGHHAAQVAQGKATDPIWPINERVAAITIRERA